MARNKKLLKQDEGLDFGMMMLGTMIGAAVGGVVALLNAPGSGRATRHRITQGVNHTGEALREKIDNVVPADPIAESIAEGKAAARRRRVELGLVEAD
jgi:gas vesicle protein